jgi:hypothetical protein
MLVVFACVVTKENDGHDERHEARVVLPDHPRELHLFIRRQELLEIPHGVLENVHVLPHRGLQRERIHEHFLILGEDVPARPSLRRSGNPAERGHRRAAVGHDEELVLSVEAHDCVQGAPVLHQAAPSPEDEHALDEVLPQARVVEPTLVFHGQVGEPLSEGAGEHALAPVRRIAFLVVDLDPASPELGERDLKTKPHRSSRSSSADRCCAHFRMRSVRSVLVRTVTSRGDAGSPTRRIDSRGTPRPHSTSGQTGTQRTCLPRVSTR